MVFLATKISDITVEELSFGIIVAVIVGVILILASKAVINAKEAENSRLPVEEAEAVCIDIQYVNAAGMALPSFIMFETNSGKRVRLSSGIDLAFNFIVGDRGYLKWQGNKLLTFLIGKNVEEAARDAAVEAAAELERQNKLRADMNMWTCGACGATNLQHWKRCADCGAKKAAVEVQAVKDTKANNVCPRCGRTQQQGDAFCAYCGQKLK